MISVFIWKLNWNGEKKGTKMTGGLLGKLTHSMTTFLFISYWKSLCQSLSKGIESEKKIERRNEFNAWPKRTNFFAFLYNKIFLKLNQKELKVAILTLVGIIIPTNTKCKPKKRKEKLHQATNVMCGQCDLLIELKKNFFWTYPGLFNSHHCVRFLGLFF